MRQPTPFEARVYAALREVPRGRVTTYGALARRLGVGSAQAVGQALKRNPQAPVVPCHRVIAARLGPGGYNGCTDGGEMARKLSLLEEEGVFFDRSGRLAEPARLWDWDERECL